MVNVNLTLLKLAANYRKHRASLSKAHKRQRCLIRGKAQALINRTYAVQENRDAIWTEWKQLAKLKIDL